MKPALLLAVVLILASLTARAEFDRAYTLGAGSCVGGVVNGSLEVAHFPSYRGNRYTAYFVPVKPGSILILQFEISTLRSAFIVMNGERLSAEIESVKLKENPANRYSHGLLDITGAAAGERIEIRDRPISSLIQKDILISTGLSANVYLPSAPRASGILANSCR